MGGRTVAADTARRARLLGGRDDRGPSRKEFDRSTTLAVGIFGRDEGLPTVRSRKADNLESAAGMGGSAFDDSGRRISLLALVVVVDEERSSASGCNMRRSFSADFCNIGSLHSSNRDPMEASPDANWFLSSKMNYTWSCSFLTVQKECVHIQCECSLP